MSEEVREFYRQNRKWLQNCAGSNEYPTVLRAMAQIVIDEASEEESNESSKKRKQNL